MSYFWRVTYIHFGYLKLSYTLRQSTSVHQETAKCVVIKVSSIPKTFVTDLTNTGLLSLMNSVHVLHTYLHFQLRFSFLICETLKDTPESQFYDTPSGLGILPGVHTKFLLLDALLDFFCS